MYRNVIKMRMKMVKNQTRAIQTGKEAAKWRPFLADAELSAIRLRFVGFNHASELRLLYRRTRLMLLWICHAVLQ